MINSIEEIYGLSVSFNTTEDCNMACKYCYEVNKARKTLSLETAKKFIDILLNTDNICRLNDDMKVLYNNITLDFIGGDALMKPKLVDEILTYWVKQVNSCDTENAKKWRRAWGASISTNGTLFSKPEVREFCEKWAPTLNLGISIDGCPELHNMNRVYVDGSPTMDDIVKNWEWLRKNFRVASLITKSTLARNSIPYIYDSLKWMHEELGLKYINQNFIMEDTHCTEADYNLLREQMDKCIYYVLDHCDDLYWSMIDLNRYARHHAPKDDEDWNTQGWCGSGMMPTLSIDGGIFPCHRWLPHTNDDGKGKMRVGDVDHGIDKPENIIKVQKGSIRSHCTRKPECRTCEYESSCPYCIGGCYAEFGDFVRTTYICEITKIQCEYAKKYWNLYNEKKGLPKEF